MGERMMNFVPRIDLRHPLDPDACGCMFGLDGVVYFAFEDPSDGYRSCAAPLLSYVGSAYEIGGDGWWPEYIKLPVIGSMEGEGGGVLVLRDRRNGAIIFEVGTDNSDDYYPSYVARWTPPLSDGPAEGQDGQLRDANK